MIKKKVVLVTGVAGFIGANLTKRLLTDDFSLTVIGIDNMNEYYDMSLKDYRLTELATFPHFIFVRDSIADRQIVRRIFEEYGSQVVVNLAAQAGVRYSIENPDAYYGKQLNRFL